MLPAPGVMLTENLRLLRLLGRGGMGSVWLAEHKSLGSEVAVKLLSHELSDDPEALERFNREATALAQLKTPHVVKIHDFGAADGTPFFVMERLEGEDLSHRLDRVQRLPIGTVTAIVVQTCKALAKVHELGVVHRDLKPANIFLTDVEGDLVVKLVDFGIAKRRDAAAVHATSDSAILGTPLYMSPEQVFSTRDVTFASDLYSLAVVAYECLAGEPPFNGETPGAIHVAIAKGGYVEISSIDRRLPKTLDAWFAKALASAPEQRFASAREMADEFMVAARGGAAAIAALAQVAEARAGVPAAARQSHSGSAVVLPPAHGGSTAPIGAIAAVLGTLCAIALTLGIVLGAKDAKKSAAKPTATEVASAEGVVESVPASASESASASASASAAASASASASASAPASSSASASASAPASATASASAPASAPASSSASASAPASAPATAAAPRAPAFVPSAFAPAPPPASTLGAPPPAKPRKNRGF